MRHDLYSYIGKPDLYAQLLTVTQINIVDAFATSAIFVMGEGNEKTSMAIITDAHHLVPLYRSPSIAEQKHIIISLEEDLYAPILKAAK